MKKYRKYIVFGYSYKYPKGALNDIISSYDSLEEALLSMEYLYCNIQIIDRDTWEIIKEQYL